jgi:hypothetical protein
MVPEIACKFSLLAPVLDGEMLDIDTARAFGRFSSVDHLDGGVIIFKEIVGP